MRGMQPVGIGLLAHDVLGLPGEKHLRSRVLLQDGGKRIQQHLHPLFGREAGRHADHGAPLGRPAFLRKGQNGFPRRFRQFHRRQDRAQFVGVAREIAGVLGVVARVGHDLVGQDARHVVLPLNDQVDQRG